MFKDKKIILGVTGSIAIYKACEVVREFVKNSADVQVVMTESAKNFVAPLTFETISNKEVLSEMFPEGKMVGTRHISVARSADAFLICPATLNIVGKIASGIADDLLTTMIMASEPSKIIFALAMNSQMYLNPIFQGNKEKLYNSGYKFVEPETGDLADADSYGIGRLAELNTIIETVESVIFGNSYFKGKKFLITAGRTEEVIDPVRFISNRSTGKMGFAIARQAKIMGADVTLISGPTELKPPAGVKFIKINTAEEMLNAVKINVDSVDVVVMSAAVADFKPENSAQFKLKKNDEGMNLNLISTPDILFEIGRNKGNKILVGFALETNNEIENATAKLKKKNLDFIVLNNPLIEGAGFGTDTNIVKIIDKNGTIEELPKMTKDEIARRLLLKIQNNSQKIP
jgi:phosphopantothenoylcysteine decarboxylase/phosphopantothenate--cysteine ligase